MDRAELYNTQAYKLMVTKVRGADQSPCVTRGDTLVAHCRLYQGGFKFSRPHICLLKVRQK